MLDGTFGTFGHDFFAHGVSYLFSLLRLASAVMSRTQLRHSSVDHSPMVISWRSRETDQSLMPTRDGTRNAVVFCFRARIREKSFTDAFFLTSSRIPVRACVSSHHTGSRAVRRSVGFDRKNKKTRFPFRRPRSARTTMTARDDDRRRTRST